MHGHLFVKCVWLMVKGALYFGASVRSLSSFILLRGLARTLWRLAMLRFCIARLVFLLYMVIDGRPFERLW